MKLIAVVLISALGFASALPVRNLTIDEEDSFKVLVLSDLMVDNDGSNFAFTVQNL